VQVGERRRAIEVEFVFAGTAVASAPALNCADAGEAMFDGNAFAQLCASEGGMAPAAQLQEQVFLAMDVDAATLSRGASRLRQAASTIVSRKPRDARGEDAGDLSRGTHDALTPQVDLKILLGEEAEVSVHPPSTRVYGDTLAVKLLNRRARQVAAIDVEDLDLAVALSGGE
jgi:hypothetical protein